MTRGFSPVLKWQGRLLVAFVIDVYARCYVDWRAHSRRRTSVVINALEQARRARKSDQDTEIEIQDFLDLDKSPLFCCIRHNFSTFCGKSLRCFPEHQLGYPVYRLSQILMAVCNGPQAGFGRRLLSSRGLKSACIQGYAHFLCSYAAFYRGLIDREKSSAYRADALGRKRDAVAHIRAMPASYMNDERGIPLAIGMRLTSLQ